MIKVVYHYTADDLIQFQNLFCLFIANIVYKFLCTLLDEYSQNSVETCRNSSVLIVRILYCNIVHLDQPRGLVVRVSDY